MRVRWALEEAGQPYDVRLVDFGDLTAPAHLALSPFGQIPTYEEDGLVLFESAAIVLHVAQRSSALLPESAADRARSTAWMFAAVNTIEPPILELEVAMLLERNEPWHLQRLPLIRQRVHRRLAQLSAHVRDVEWLSGRFSAADIVMVCVLRRLAGSADLTEHPALVRYVRRGEARPAFQRAFDAQLAVFRDRFVKSKQ